MFGLYPCPLRKLTQYICQFTSSSDLAAKFLSLYPSASGRILLASQSLIRLSKRAREVNFPLSRSAHRTDHSCQMAIARFSDRMCLALRASGLWLRYATLQNLIPSFPWIVPGWRAWGAIQGKEEIKFCSAA